MIGVQRNRTGHNFCYQKETSVRVFNMVIRFQGNAQDLTIECCQSEMEQFEKWLNNPNSEQYYKVYVTHRTFLMINKNQITSIEVSDLRLRNKAPRAPKILKDPKPTNT